MCTSAPVCWLGVCACTACIRRECSLRECVVENDFLVEHAFAVMKVKEKKIISHLSIRLFFNRIIAVFALLLFPHFGRNSMYGCVCVYCVQPSIAWWLVTQYVIVVHKSVCFGCSTPFTRSFILAFVRSFVGSWVQTLVRHESFEIELHSNAFGCMATRARSFPFDMAIFKHGILFGDAGDRANGSDARLYECYRMNQIDGQPKLGHNRNDAIIHLP